MGKTSDSEDEELIKFEGSYDEKSYTMTFKTIELETNYTRYYKGAIFVVGGNSVVEGEWSDRSKIRNSFKMVTKKDNLP